MINCILIIIVITFLKSQSCHSKLIFITKYNKVIKNKFLNIIHKDKI